MGYPYETASDYEQFPGLFGSPVPPVAGQLSVPGQTEADLMTPEERFQQTLGSPMMASVSIPQKQSAIGAEMAAWDPEKQRRFGQLDQQGQQEALLSTQAAQQIEKPMNKGGLFNDFTIKDYAALMSAAGTLGSMLIPKPKQKPRLGGQIQGPGGGNPFLRRYV